MKKTKAEQRRFIQRLVIALPLLRGVFAKTGDVIDDN
jgi:hypothetical protein